MRLEAWKNMLLWPFRLFERTLRYIVFNNPLAKFIYKQHENAAKERLEEKLRRGREQKRQRMERERQEAEKAAREKRRKEEEEAALKAKLEAELEAELEGLSPFAKGNVLFFRDLEKKKAESAERER